MNLLPQIRKALGGELSTELAASVNRPLRPAHWRRWYYLGPETRFLLLSRMRWWFFLVYPAWVATHLGDYKPDPERIRKAFYEAEIGSPISPLAKMKAWRETFGEEPKAL